MHANYLAQRGRWQSLTWADPDTHKPRRWKASSSPNVCVYSNSRNDVPRGGPAVRNHCRTHPAPCVRPRYVCSVLRAHVQFCRFDKADATADILWHCNHRPPLWYHYFPAQSSLGADILVYWIGKIVQTCAPVGVEPSTSCVQGEHPIH